MRSSSPNKMASSRLLFTKNIRLNVNSKLIPSDFFPQSISHCCKSRKTNEKSNQIQSPKKSLPQKNATQIDYQFRKEVKDLEVLKRRLIRIKQSSSSSSVQDEKEKIFSKRNIVSANNQIKTSANSKMMQINQNEQKDKRYSKKMIDYMQKMKGVMNIDLKFEEDLVSPIYSKRQIIYLKQYNEDVETDDSPKHQHFRPRSEISNKEKLFNRQKVDSDMSKLMSRPLRTIAKETSIIKKQKFQEKIKKNDRYNKFVDIHLNEEGMLTFYGSFNQNRDSYDSRKYSARSSLPKLQK